MSLPAGVKPFMGKSLGWGLWGGGLGGAALVLYNASKYGGLVPGVNERAALISAVAIVVCGGLGWAFWSGLVLKD